MPHEDFKSQIAHEESQNLKLPQDGLKISIHPKNPKKSHFTPKNLQKISTEDSSEDNDESLPRLRRNNDELLTQQLKLNSKKRGPFFRKQENIPP